jgi:hypothetical protein
MDFPMDFFGSFGFGWDGNEEVFDDPTLLGL